MGDQQVLQLLGIDVHPAGDDHEALAVGQVEEAVLVQPAHIAQRRPAVPVGVLGHLIGRIVIAERRAAGEIDDALAARRQRLAVVAADLHLGRRALAHRALVGQPVVRADMAEAVALAAGVVFVDDRPPPLHHLLLDRDGAGGGGVDGRRHRGQVVAGADLRRQFQHPDEVGGHELAAVDAVFFDQLQGVLGIEFLHHHHRAAQALIAHAPAQGGGVIEGRGRQIGPVGREAEHVLGHHGQRVGGVDRPAGQRRLDPLGPAGGA